MKKLFALLLAVVMVVGLFAACVQEADPTTGTQKPTESQNPTTGNDDTTAGTDATEAPAIYPIENAVNFEYNTWLSYWEAYHESLNESPVMAELAKRTGVLPEWSVFDTDEEFNMMLSSGEYTDVFQKTNKQMPGGPQGSYDEGIIIGLNDIIDQYMPNLKATLEADAELLKSVSLADGTIYCFPLLGAENPSNAFVNGPFIRKDLMAKYNITELPETIDDWYDMLKVFKDNGIKAPFAANVSQLTTGGPFIGAYIGAHVDSNGMFNDGEGNLDFAYTTDAYKDYVKMLKKFNDAGLFGDDFIAISTADIKANNINGDSAASHGYLASGIQSLTLAGKELNADFEYVSPKFPSVEKGGLTFGNCSYPARFGGYGAFVSSKCEEEKFETVGKWFDYLYSEEGMYLMQYGIEGESYEIIDGKYTYTEKYNTAPDGWEITAWKQEWSMTGSGVNFVGHGDAYPQTLTMDSSKNALNTWLEQGTAAKWQDHTIPGTLTYTSEQTEEMTEITTELIAYAKAQIASFVKGDLNIDTDWAAFVKACEDYGCKDLVEICQDAYDAYFDALK